MTVLANALTRPPPHGAVLNWLGADMVARLLDFAEARRDNFRVAAVGNGQNRKINLDMRRARKFVDLGDLKDELRLRVEEVLPTLFKQLDAKAFAPARYELEIVAHGDGAFYGRHCDNGSDANPRLHRAVSAVYYFHRQPKAFSGGALRLYSIADLESGGTFVDVEPVNDSLIFFPSLFPHEVMPVACPSGKFSDSRFAINCWLHSA